MLYESPAGLGFSLNPFHYAKKGVVAVGKGAKYAGKGVYTAGKYGAKGAVAIAKNPYVQQGVSAFVPGGGAAVMAANAILPGGKGGPASVQTPPAGGTVDLTQVQDAAAQAASAANDAVQEATTPPGMVRLPGVGAVKRSHLMIGGGILAAVVVLSLLKK